MSQHLIKEIQQLKQEVAQLKETQGASDITSILLLLDNLKDRLSALETAAQRD